MFKKYDLAVKTREYTDSQGNKKAVWKNVGCIMEKPDGGRFIMLERTFNPAGVPDFSGKGGDSVLISMFEPKQQDGQRQAGGGGGNGGGGAPASAAAGGGVADDDIPFARAYSHYAF